jgi:hypothetical protein
MKRLLVLFLLATAGTVAVFFHFWNKATQLPDWYTSQASENNVTGLKSQEEFQQSREKIEAKIATSAQPTTSNAPSLNPKQSPNADAAIVRREQLETSQNQAATSTPATSTKPAQSTNSKKNVAVKLSKNELNDLVVSDFTRRTDGSKLAQAVRAVNTEVQNGKIESGAVVSLANIPINQLHAGEKDTLSRILGAFPALKNQNVYIAIEGEPEVENGQVKFGENTRIRLGDLSFTPAEIAQRLGVPEAEVRKRINLELELRGLDINDVKLMKDGVVLEGSAQPQN